MSDSSTNTDVGLRFDKTEEAFAGLFQTALLTTCNKSINVKYGGSKALEFKTIKAALQGEVVFVSMSAKDGASGRIQFAFTKETSAYLADLALSGSGNAVFNPDEHLEPLKYMFIESMNNYTNNLGKKLDRHLSFDDPKIVLIDLTPQDFVEGGWTVSQLELQSEPKHAVYRLISKDFLESCFPNNSDLHEFHEQSGGDSAVDDDTMTDMGLLLDIELPITIELGRTNMLIRDIVKLAPGAIVELDKLSGEPVDLYVNHKKFGRGEVVVVDENFAVRVTELVNPDARMRASRN